MLLSALLALPSPALAWTSAGSVWLDADIPLAWWLDEEPAPTLPDGYALSAVERGWAAWETPAAACAGLASSFRGVEDLGAPTFDHEGVWFFYEDPGDDLDVGVLALTVFPVMRETAERGGVAYAVKHVANVVFNDGVPWTTDEAIDGGDCDGEFSVVGVATHEIGHVWGFGHSCEEGEACGDADARNASMYWASTECDTSQSTIGADDAAAALALYGPWADVQLTEPRVGRVPFSVGFEATSDDAIAAVRWTFGDGAESGGNPVVHTYEAQGAYTVRARVELSAEDCSSGVVQGYRAVGAVVACAAPAPEPGASSAFELQPAGGLTWQVVNHLDTSVYGCLDTLTWSVFRGVGEADLVEANRVDTTGQPTLSGWAPAIAFPEPGRYLVKVDAGGPGGESAAFVAVEVRGSGGGCASVPGAPRPLGVGALLVGLVALGRRSRA